MKTCFISLPTKKTEEVNWSKPLKNYLLSLYGSVSDYQDDLKGLDKLRQDIRGVNADSTGVKLFYKYYSQLELIDLRTPFETLNKSKKLEFVWYDAFDHGVSYKQTTLPFEKANVLFNLAATLSKFASAKYEESQKNISSSAVDSATKGSLSMYQQAAGIFSFLGENFLHAPSADLSQRSVEFYIKLMLAQAQEVFVLKAISGDLEQKKNSLIAKLCSGTKIHYEACKSLLDNTQGDAIPSDSFNVVDDEDELERLEEVGDTEKAFAHIDSSWNALVTFKFLFYDSLSYYFNGLSLEKSGKVGEAIANYNKSSQVLDKIESQILKNMARSGFGNVYELLDNYKYQKDAIKIKVVDLEKDNDFIYHEIIPSTNSVPEIKPLDSVKQVSINDNDLFKEINDHNYRNFLAKVVPINIYELSSYYSEEKSQFLRNELDLVDASNEELSSILEYLQMPHALVNLKQNYNASESESQGYDISQQTTLYADEIAKKGSSDDSNKQRIDMLRKAVYDYINEIESMIAQQYSDSAISVKHELIKLKKSLYEAFNSDKKLFGLINEENTHLYSSLRMGSHSNKFKQLFEVPQSTTSSDGNEINLVDLDQTKKEEPIDQKIQNLEDILNDLNILKVSKAKVVEALKKDIHEDDISDILILNSKIKSTNEIKTLIFPEELRKFSVYNEKLDALIDKQKFLIDELKDGWSKLGTDPKIKELQSSSKYKEEIARTQTAKIIHFYEKVWMVYSKGLANGVTFYEQLIKYAEDLKSKASSSDYTRNSSGSLADSFGSLNIQQEGNSATRQPPMSYGSQTQQSVDMSYSHQTPGDYMRDASNIASGYQPSKPPQLPPKQPSVESNPVSSRTQDVPPIHGFNHDSDLIYSQPSTYKPNMYDFFSNSNNS